MLYYFITFGIAVATFCAGALLAAHIGPVVKITVKPEEKKKEPIVIKLKDFDK